MSMKNSNSLKSGELLKDDLAAQDALQTSQQMSTATLGANRNISRFAGMGKSISPNAKATTECSFGVFAKQKG